MNEDIISMAIERKVLLIEGMICVNCQNRIEQALRNIAGISKVYVSYSKGQAEIEFDNDILTLDRIIAVIQNLDYKVVKKRKKDYSEFVNRAVTFAIIILLYCLLQRFGILNLLVPSMLADSKMSYGMLFLVGLLTSIHCIAMCGGINLSQCIPVADDDNGKTPKNKIILPSLLYNTGRVISYSVIGFLLGGMGMLLTRGGGMGIPLLLQGILKIIAGLFMVIMGINMLGWIPLLRKFQIRFPQSLADKINKKRRRENRPFFIGLLNGLMPCGPMQSMQIIALGSGNPVSGAAAMLMFSLGTVPLMLGFGSLDTSEAENTESDAEKEETVVYETPAVENGEISINADTLTSNPMYINYDSNGTNIQLIAVKGSDGTPRLSLNTCQVCNPSPKAYFKEQNGRLVCQNCGNVFTIDSVGETTGGCNPMYIDYKNTDGKLTVTVADLDTYTDQFASWDGPVK